MNTLDQRKNNYLFHSIHETTLPITKIESLKDLYSEHSVNYFEECSFFNQNNLLQPSSHNQKQMKGKVFKNNPHSLLFIFTMQYLQLCYHELQQTNCSMLNNLILQLMQQQQFQIMCPPQNNPFSQCSQPILKNIIKQFISYINQNHLFETVEHILAQYPLILNLFAGIYLTLLQLGQVINNYNDYLEIQQTYNLLTSYFQIQASIDPTNKCVCFQENNTFVLQGKNGQIYLIENNYEQQPIRQSYLKEKKNQSKLLLPIDAQKLSIFLNDNITAQNELEEEQSVIRHISNIEIPLQTSFQNERNTHYSCKLAQSEIINEHKNNRSNIKYEQNKCINLTNESKSVTTTFSSFRENSVKGNVIDSLKAFIEAPSILKSQLLEMPTFSEIKSNMSGFYHILKCETQEQEAAKQEKQKKCDEANEEIQLSQQSSLSGKTPLIESNIIETCQVPSPEFIRSYTPSPQIIHNLICESQLISNSHTPKFSSRQVPQPQTFSSQQTQLTNSDFLQPQSIQCNIVEPQLSNSNHNTQPQIVNISPQIKLISIPSQPSPTTAHISNKVTSRWLNKDITKQFTSSFLLQMISQPYKSRIKAKKNKARQQRKNIFQSNHYFI